MAEGDVVAEIWRRPKIKLITTPRFA